MKMDLYELGLKMLEWEKKTRNLEELGDEICSVVLDIGKTQTVGNVRATFANGRKEYDYETPGSQASSAIIDLYTEEEERIDWEGLARNFAPTVLEISQFTDLNKTIKWSKVCKEAKIDPVVLSQKDPSVKIKLME